MFVQKALAHDRIKNMNIVHVIPLMRTMRSETLSYFTSRKVTPGSFVFVPIRNKNVYALVVSVEDVSSKKLSIKDAPYGMKKVVSVYDESFFLPQFLKAMERSAEYFAAPTGAILQNFTPQTIVEKYTRAFDKKETETKKVKKQQKKIPPKVQGYEKFPFQNDEEDRMASYRSLIREYFAKQLSVFVCLPTIEDVERVAPLLNKGIAEYTFILHSEVRKKDLIERWERALEKEHPILIVATGSFLSLPREDVGALIVDKENAGGFKTLKRPYLDIRTCAEFLAQELGIKYIVGDVLLRTETLYEREEEDLIDFSPLKFRSISHASQKLLDMKAYKTREGDNAFVLISDEVKEAITQAQENNEPFFLLTARRGLYPITLCNDCGDTVRCKRCSSPLVLHGKEKAKSGKSSDEKNIFMCHTCSEVTRSRDVCESCGGWRFGTLGIGSERVEKEIKKLFPDAKVLRLDKDTAKTKGSIRKILRSFKSKESGILVGTEMAIAHLGNEIENSAVISIDSLFTIPDFRIYERVFALLLRLRGKTRRRFFIQTRLKEKPIFEHVIEGNLLNFYREELELRKRFSYPPFTTFIKLTRSGKKDLVEYDMAKLETFLANYDPITFSALTPVKGSTTMHAVIRLPKGVWPHERLRARLLKLPPSFAIRVDPENIL